MMSSDFEMDLVSCYVLVFVSHASSVHVALHC